MSTLNHANLVPILACWTSLETENEPESDATFLPDELEDIKESLYITMPVFEGGSVRQVWPSQFSALYCVGGKQNDVPRTHPLFLSRSFLQLMKTYYPLPGMGGFQNEVKLAVTKLHNWPRFQWAQVIFWSNYHLSSRHKRFGCVLGSNFYDNVRGFASTGLFTQGTVQEQLNL